MSSSSLEPSVAESYVDSWASAHAENLRSAVRDIHVAIEDALKRLEATGWHDGKLKKLTTRYNVTKNWRGLDIYKPVNEELATWELVSNCEYFFISLDGNLYTQMRGNNRRGKKSASGTWSIHFLSDEDMSAIIKNWTSEQIAHIVAMIDGICPVTEAITATRALTEQA